MLNLEVFENVRLSQSKILIVTKYWDTETTLKIHTQARELYPEIIFGIWENRIETIKEKNLPREIVHFIGNIQSQKISEIVKHCNTLHSLSSLKHAIKIESIWLPISAFIQINLDANKEIWISEDTFWYFLKACHDFKYLKIIWISGMWAQNISELERRKEFQKLVFLRNKYLSEWSISAWTSRDYKIALKEWIDIVRVGSQIMS